MKPTGTFHGNDDNTHLICTRALTQRLFIDRQMDQSVRLERRDGVYGALGLHNFDILFYFDICITYAIYVLNSKTFFANAFSFNSPALLIHVPGK